MRQQTTPPENVIEILQERERLSVFLRALNSTELREFLEDEDRPHTVFAPLNSAFDKLPGDQFDVLFRNTNREVLRRVVRRHIIPGLLRSSSLKNRNVETLGGASVATESTTNRRAFGGGELTRTDILASNGLIHTIDRVSIPENLAEMLA